MVDWIIVGAETGNRKKKAKSSPDLSWLRALNGYAIRNGIPILFKNSKELKAVWGADQELIQQFPDGLRKGGEVHGQGRVWSPADCKDCGWARSLTSITEPWRTGPRLTTSRKGSTAASSPLLENGLFPLLIGTSGSKRFSIVK